MNKLYFYGHNCFVVESAAARLLIDPWLTPQGAFFGSWHQFPDNTHLRQPLVEKAADKDTYVYLTHEHRDHFDPETLAMLAAAPRFRGFFIPAFHDPYLREQLDVYGKPVTEVADTHKQAVADDIGIQVFVSDIGVNHDSAVLVTTPDFTLLNQNDCKIFDRLQTIGLPRINYYSVQFSGATWHPVCFRMPEAEKRRISEKKVAVKFNNVLGAIRHLRPDFYLPAAGPAVFPFLDEKLSTEPGSIFTHQPELVDFLNSQGVKNVLCPRPGDEISADTTTDPIPRPTHEAFLKLRAGKPDVWGALEAKFDAAALMAAVEERLDQIWDLDIPEDTPRIVFSWGEGEQDCLTIDLVEKRVERGLVGSGASLRLIAGEKYFWLMHAGERWQDVYLSLQAEVERQPDVFNSIANVFIFSDPSNVRAALLSTLRIPKERIERSWNGKKCTIDRYCPHQGADLGNAHITEDGFLVCPRHGWQFDLNDGGRCTASSDSINSEVLE